MGEEFGELRHGRDDVGGSGVAKLLLVVCAGQSSGDDGCAGTNAAEHVVGRVAEYGDLVDVVDRKFEQGSQNQVRVRSTATGLGGGRG